MLLLRRPFCLTLALLLPFLACGPQPSETPKACTLVACAPYRLTIESSASSFGSGNFELTFTVDGKTSVCTLSSATNTAQCTEGVGTASLSFDSGKFELELNDLPANKAASVDFKRDTIVLGQKDFTPNLAAREPNGPGCGTCYTGSDVWTL
jgi:hypothetical protein